MARATSTRWIVSMMPMPRPVTRPVNGLRVEQMRIHPRRRVDEPGAQVAGGVGGVPPLARQQPGGGQRGHVQAQSHHRPAMGDEVVGIGHSVALDVRAPRIVGIRPPVVAFGEKIVAPAGAARARRRGDGTGSSGR